METEIQQQLLKDVRVLAFSSGPSGRYAVKLLEESGAFIERVSLGEVSAASNIMGDEASARHCQALKDDRWDMVIWDSNCSGSLGESVLSYVDDACHSPVGVRICFPAGIGADEERDLQAIGGWMELTGDPNKVPLNVGGHPASCLIGAHAATGGLIALAEKQSTGRGRLVDISASTILAGALEGVLSKYLDSGTARTRKGNRHNSLTPMAILPASDGWVFVGAPVDEQWALLERWAGLPHNLEWMSAEDRSSHQEPIETALADWSSEMKREELFVMGQAFRLPFGNVQSLKEVRDCAHLKARGFWSENKMGLPWKTRRHTDKRVKNNAVKPPGGLKIIDLTSMWSGPYCTRLFADLGAEAVKVEALHRPDGIRPTHGNRNPFFSELNRNKLGIDLNLTQEKDREHFLKLVETADVLVENFSPRVMVNLGLHDEKLWELNPNLLIVSLSAFGQSGPYRDYIGYGPTIESMAGLSCLTGYGDGKPWLPGFSVSDLGAGIHGAFALAAALYDSNRKGTGMKVDVSQYEVACRFTEDYMPGYETGRKSCERRERNGLVEFFENGDINVLAMEDGSMVLGPPWESEGWAPNNSLPPKLGEHRELILQPLNRPDNSGRGIC